MTDRIEIRVRGLDKVISNFEHLQKDIKRYMGHAGREAANMVLDEEGLRKYPAVVANKPPMPMTDEQRRGYFAKLRAGEIEVPYRRGQRPGSEKYGSQWYIKNKGHGVVVGNRASYANYLMSKGQAGYMRGLGWKQLFEVAKGKTKEITRIFQAWVDKLVRDVGL